METTLIISNLLLWIVIVVLLIVVYALARQIGVLHERVAPVGALMPMSGPKIGETIEPLTVESLTGEAIVVGEPEARKTMLYFLSPGCPVCKSLLPVVQDLARKEAGELRLIYASDGETKPVHQNYAEEHKINPNDYVLSQELGMRLGVNKLPFAVLFDREGILKGRGLVNNREHVESLLTADELDVSSLQEYLGMDDNPITNVEPGEQSRSI